MAVHNYTIGDLFKVLENGTIAQKMDIAKRYPALATANDARAVLLSLTAISARKAENLFRQRYGFIVEGDEDGAEVDEMEAPVLVAKKKPAAPVATVSTGKRGRPAKVKSVVEEDDEEEEEEEEAPAPKRGRGRPAKAVVIEPEEEEEEEEEEDTEEDDTEEEEEEEEEEPVKPAKKSKHVEPVKASKNGKKGSKEIAKAGKKSKRVVSEEEELDDLFD